MFPQELNKFQEAETQLNSLGSYSAHKVGFSRDFLAGNKIFISTESRGFSSGHLLALLRDWYKTNHPANMSHAVDRAVL